MDGNETNEELREALQKQLNCVAVEWYMPLEDAVASVARTWITGDSEESRHSRFCQALTSLLATGVAHGGELVCFAVSMGIKAAAWCRTCSIEYEPDYVFLDKKEKASAPYSLFGARAMIEVVWNNRSFLENPAAIDPGLLFQELQSYVMIDSLRRRLVLFRSCAGWRPEVYEGARLPARIDGLGFEIDWAPAYRHTLNTDPFPGSLWRDL